MSCFCKANVGLGYWANQEKLIYGVEQKLDTFVIF